MLKPTVISAKITFNEPVLGAQTTRDVTSEFIIKRAGMEQLPEDEEEMLAVELEKATTVFHRINGDPLRPCLMDYQVKGFLKEAANTANNTATWFDGVELPAVKNYRSKVGNYVFVTPRVIPVNIPAGMGMDFYERPIRVQTMQGPRVALARSERIPSGSYIYVDISVLIRQQAGKEVEVTPEHVLALMTYGQYQGMGQNRGAGWGQFSFEYEISG